MPSAFVLYLTDHVAGPALELVRRIAQPTSHSKPHVTVRYPVRKIDTKQLAVYRRESIDHIELHGAGQFTGRGEKTFPKTVYIECFSDRLERLVYKPDYPDSVFHVTLYDGPPSQLSQAVFDCVNKFRWQLDVMLPSGTRLTEIPIGLPHPSGLPKLTRAASDLLVQLTDGDVTAADLAKLEDQSRLVLIEQVCEHLHVSLLAVEAHRESAERYPDWLQTSDRLIRRVDGQMMLWDDVQALERGLLTGSMLNQREFARSLSLFLTPPEVASDMTRTALAHHGSTRPVDFGDPAVGNGIFLASLLSHTSNLRSAIGVDINEDRIAALNRRWNHTPFQGIMSNFLDAPPAEPRSLIVANPPYLRSQRLDRSDTERWSQRLEAETGVGLSGRADLFAYFLLGCHRWMQPGGIGCWLLPIEFMQTNYGAAVRRYLSTQVTLIRAHLYDPSHSRFENARVSSVVILIKKIEPTSEHLVELTLGDSMEFPTNSRTIANKYLQNTESWKMTSSTWLGAAARKARTSGPKTHQARLGEIFRVRRGIATGANSLFVVDDVTRSRLGGSEAWYKPAIPKSRVLESNVVEADMIGRPIGMPRLWLIDTDADLAEIAAVAPNLAAYLSDIHDLVGQRRLLRDRNPFYAQDKVPPPPIFFGYMSRTESTRFASRFFLNRSRGVILNNYLGLFPIGALKHAIDGGALSIDDAYSIVVEIEKSALDENSRHYADGLAKTEPSELMSVPLGPRGRAVATSRSD